MRKKFFFLKFNNNINKQKKQNKNKTKQNANYFYITFINENKLTTKDGEEVISKYNSSYAISFKAMYMEAF